ncbi:Auxin response factor 23 [Platanthera zijinensis]|uniref:Auxin response factor 23 n=1 Tax=Platanthera zijinensis TaxID=2320716 RepID=A0AAP0C0L6_9ASPA
MLESSPSSSSMSRILNFNRVLRAKATTVILKIRIFCKTLSTSDTSTHRVFSVLMRYADECLPALDIDRQPPTQELVAKDLRGVEWFTSTIIGVGDADTKNDLSQNGDARPTFGDDLDKEHIITVSERCCGARRLGAATSSIPKVILLLGTFTVLPRGHRSLAIYGKPNFIISPLEFSGGKIPNHLRKGDKGGIDSPKTKRITTSLVRVRPGTSTAKEGKGILTGACRGGRRSRKGLPERNRPSARAAGCAGLDDRGRRSTRKRKREKVGLHSVYPRCCGARRLGAATSSIPKVILLLETFTVLPRGHRSPAIYGKPNFIISPLEFSGGKIPNHLRKGDKGGIDSPKTKRITTSPVRVRPGTSTAKEGKGILPGACRGGRRSRKGLLERNRPPARAAGCAGLDDRGRRSTRKRKREKVGLRSVYPMRKDFVRVLILAGCGFLHNRKEESGEKFLLATHFH